MALTLADIHELAMDLTAEDRAKLVTLLLDSLPEAPPARIEAAWAVEIERRVADVESGKAKLLSWEEVREEMYCIAAGGGYVARREDSQP